MSNAEWNPSGPSGGVCALHPESPATQTCERCGNYACDVCTGSGVHAMCPACRERLGLGDFTLTRELTSFNSVFGAAWATFSAQWIPLSLASLIYFGISMAFGFCSNLVQTALAGQGDEAAIIGALLGLAISVVQNCVLAMVLLGIIHMSYRALEGSAPNVADIFSQVSRFFPWLAQVIVAGLVIGLPVGLLTGIPLGIGFAMDEPQLGMIGAGVVMLLLLIPLIYVGLGLYFAQFELVYDRSVGPIEALKRSWQLADGHRMTIFGTSFVGALLMIAGVFACCVGIIPATAFFYLLIATLHKALRNGSGLPEPIRTF